MNISLEEFENEILEVLENLPSRFRDKFQNIGFVIEEEDTGPARSRRQNIPHYTLGLYHGVPMTSKTTRGQIFPDRIIIYKKAIEAVSRDKKTLKKKY